MSDDAAALVVQLEARITQFEQQMNKAVRGAYGAASKIEAAFSASNDNVIRKTKGSKGFGNVISSSIKEVESQAQGLNGRLGSLGNVLGGLGPLGLAAGAGLGAVAIGIGQARAAMDMADELSDSAAKLNINVVALQEYRFAVRAAGGELTDADKALAAFNVTLGQAQAGYKKPLKVFELLGFTKADLDQVKSGEELLPRIADKIRNLSSEAQRAAIIDKLGLTGLKPLLEQGADGMQKLIQAQRDLGIVLDEQTIAKAAEAHDKLEALSTVIDTQLKVAFIGLAGPIVEATQYLADFLSWIAKVANDPTTKRLVEAGTKISGAFAKGMAEGGPVRASVEASKAAYSVGKRRITNRYGADDIRDMLNGGGVTLPSDFNDVYGKGKSGGGLPPHLATLSGSGGGNTAEARARADGRYAGGARTVDGLAQIDAVAAIQNADLFVPHGGLEEYIRKGGGNFEAAGPALEKASRALEDLTRRTYDGIYDATYGALEAAFQDGPKGVLRYFLRSLEQGLMQAVSSSVASAGANGTGGPLVQSIAKFAKFAGFFDGGGNIPAGQWGIAGEFGPEPVKGPATVIGRADTMRALRGANPVRGAATVIVQEHHHNDFRGAVMTEDLVASFERRARQAENVGALKGAALARQGAAGAQLEMDALGR